MKPFILIELTDDSEIDNVYFVGTPGVPVIEIDYNQCEIEPDLAREKRDEIMAMYEDWERPSRGETGWVGGPADPVVDALDRLTVIIDEDEEDDLDDEIEEDDEYEEDEFIDEEDEDEDEEDEDDGDRSTAPNSGVFSE